MVSDLPVDEGLILGVLWCPGDVSCLILVYHLWSHWSLISVINLTELDYVRQNYMMYYKIMSGVNVILRQIITGRECT